MASILEVFLTFLRMFWWIFPPFAVLLYFLMQYWMRAITNRVLYLRRGGTMEFHSCEVKGGSHIRFTPNKGTNLTVQLRAQPYLYVKGLNTYRIYVVVEGGGGTVRFSELPEIPIDFKATWESAFNSLPEDVRKFIDAEKFLAVPDGILDVIGESDYDNVGIDDIRSSEPTDRAAASSIALFERVNEFITEMLPKGKTQWIFMFIYLIVGYVGGITMGMLLCKLGVV